MSELTLCPITISEAKVWITRTHRHHPAPVSALFAVACEAGGEIVGVATIGRPSARLLQDGYTAEVTRVATDGTPNACSILYGAAWRACRALGYRKLITYTLQSEGGVSLRASGWRVVGEVSGRSWSSPSRPRVDKTPEQDKLRWERAIEQNSTHALLSVFPKGERP